MSFKLRNWKLATLALIIFCAFISLGLWQLSRAHQKELLLKNYSDRMNHAPLTLPNNVLSDIRFYQARIEGEFDNAHTFLLDNKTFKGQIGYEVYTPFKIKGLNAAILVDRGFIAIKGRRETLPVIQDANAKTITGLINLPPAYFALGNIQASEIPSWPMRIEYINLAELTDITHYSFLPYVLILKPGDANAYAIEWQIVLMPPEKHRAYALQWFAFALTLLVLFVILNKQNRDR